ncbi:MAG: DUF2173 family protein [Pseudomonadota bacterium]|uniref:DUF2173 family protein n=1 Tax=Thermithiobacillus tepidarius TaxID=929 RepID=UPI00041D0402|nr:DUF2173 family protein [Thermithiobacillus tepidarius]
MMRLESLLSVKGTVAALRFYDDGSLAEAVGEIDPGYAGLAAELCYANGRILQQQGDMLTAFSGMGGWTPPRGWAMSGPELSVCAMGEVACFVRNAEVSFNELFHTLYKVAHD